jgi:putative sporulation protein YyaC
MDGVYMNVKVTDNYRIRTDSQQFIVEERHIVDPTKIPDHLRKKDAAAPVSMEIREEYRPIAYYNLTPASLELALDCVRIRESIQHATNVNAETIGEFIAIIRETTAGVRGDIRNAFKAETTKLAVAHEDVFNGSKIGGCATKDELITALSAIIPNHLTATDVVFACIGTDRSIGDALGPLVGTYLAGIGYSNIIGTIDEPLHAMNLAERLRDEVPAGKTVIAIDACLGRGSSVGNMNAISGAIKPGAGVNKDLGSVGEYGITATVNVGGFREFEVLQNTRLSVVMRLARDITSAIVATFPLDGKRSVAAPIALAPVKRKVGRPRKKLAEVNV